MTEMKAIILNYAITNALCVGVIFILWNQNRKRFRGFGFGLAGFILQTIGLLLVVLRGSLPDFISMVVSNTMIVGGAILLLVGLERFTGTSSKQTRNALYLATFAAIHAYFVYVQPSLQARNINLSFGLTFLCAQCVWLVVRKVDVEMRSILRNVGIVLAGYCAVNVFRILLNVMIHPGDDLFQSNAYDTLLILLNQILFIMLTFSLVLAVNQRLVVDMSFDIENRRRTEEKLRESEKNFRALFEQAAVGVAKIETATGRFITINQRYCDILGYSREEILKISFKEITHPDDLQADLNNMDRLCRNEIRAFSMEKRYIHKNGSIIWISLSVSPLWHPGEMPDFHIAVIEDITARKQAEMALLENETIFTSFLENSPVYVFFKDKNIRTLRLSRNYEQMLGMPISEALGKTMDDLFPSDLAKSMVADDLWILNEGKRVETVEELNGHVYETTKFPILKDGVPEMLAGFTLDITERKNAEDLLQSQYHYLSALQETTLELISELDLGILLENIVKRAGALVDTESGFLDLVDTETNALRPHIGLGALKESLDHAAQPNEGVAGTVWQTGKPLVINDYDGWEGRIKGFSINKIGATIGVPLLLESRVLGVLGLAYDIQSGKTFAKETVEILIQFARLATIAIKNSRLFANVQQTNEELKVQLDEIEKLQASLRELSIRDPLTGVFNRRYMEESMRQECARAEREGYPVSIVILDLDHLKSINGSYGHITGGDQALRLLGDHLKSASRAGDIVCRYGGDEFLVILHNAQAKSAYQRVEKWRVALTGMDIKYYDMKFNISFSAGIAAFPEHGKNIEEILIAADYALFRAKEFGRNRVELYDGK